MTTFREYPIYKKRDGQSYKQVSYIYADSFDAAKKEFAKNMTNDNWEKSNNIVWLDKENDGVEQTGWYDLDGSVLQGRGEEGEEIDYANSEMELFCSEEAINEGFTFWNEDVYTWEIRDIKTFDVFQDGEFYETIEEESIEKAMELYPEEDGFKVTEK